MEYKYFSVEQDDGFSTITLNKPPSNSLNRAVLQEFLDLAGKIENDKSVRCMILTGAGDQSFSTGWDLIPVAAPIITAKRKGKELTIEEKKCLVDISYDDPQRLFDRVEKYNKPIIAAINGIAFGCGATLAVSAHIRYASESIYIGWPELRYGMLPPGGAATRLRKLIGPAKTLELLLTGDLITAKEAEKFGIFNKIVPPENLLQEAKSLAKKLGKGPPLAMRSILKEIEQGFDHDSTQAMAQERENAINDNAVKEINVGIEVWLKSLKNIPKDKAGYRAGIIAHLEGLNPKFEDA